MRPSATNPLCRLQRTRCAWRVALWGALAIVLQTASPTARAQAPGQPLVINREYAIKAAYLYHFCSYVEWQGDELPAEDQPLVIGVFHSDPFGGSLDEVAQTKKVNGRPIAVKQIAAASAIADCHVLFIPRATPPELQRAAIEATRDRAVLVVGETEDFIAQGGEAQFYVEANKVRFAFSSHVTEQQQLKVSSKLLSLAKIVSP